MYKVASLSANWLLFIKFHFWGSNRCAQQRLLFFLSPPFPANSAMLFKQILLIAFSTTPLLCIAQKHDYNWMWGYDNESIHPLLGGANMNFSTMPPLIYTEKKKVDIDFYCGVCSDSSGVLEFYTNGMAIRDTTHEIMLNGDHINPGIIWDDWTAAYPFPRNRIPVCQRHIPRRPYLCTGRWQPWPIYL